MESFGIQVNDQMYQQMRGRVGIAPYTTAGGVLVMSPIITAVMAGILFAVFNAGHGRQATFKQVLQRGRACRRDFGARRNCSPAR